MQDFMIKIEHPSGHQMQYVDAFSRASYGTLKESDMASLRIAKATINQDDLFSSIQL